MRTYEHIDLDYDSFPIPDLSLDLNFVHLSATEHRAQINAQISARHEAEAQARLAKLPEDHKVILVPAHPTYSPRQAELWPLISPSSSSAVQEALRPYPGIFTEVLAAIRRVVDAHRGWKNPLPPDLPAPLGSLKNKKLTREPGDLLQNKRSHLLGFSGYPTCRTQHSLRTRLTLCHDVGSVNRKAPVDNGPARHLRASLRRTPVDDSTHGGPQVRCSGRVIRNPNIVANRRTHSRAFGNS